MPSCHIGCPHLLETHLQCVPLAVCGVSPGLSLFPAHFSFSNSFAPLEFFSSNGTPFFAWIHVIHASQFPLVKFYMFSVH